MATGSILLPIGAALLPDGSSGNWAAGLERVKTSVAAPAPHFLQLAFDAIDDEHAMWSFRMPVNYASGPVLKTQYKMKTATTGQVVIAGRIAAVSDGDAVDVDAKGFGAVNTSAAVTVPAVAGHLDEISLALGNADSLAAGDFVVLWLSRDANHASDTAGGDMEVVGVTLEYTTL